MHLRNRQEGRMEDQRMRLLGQPHRSYRREPPEELIQPHQLFINPNNIQLSSAIFIPAHDQTKIP